MSERLVLLGGVEPVEVVIPDPAPPKPWREVLRGLEAKLGATKPGKPVVLDELELCALAAGIELVREKSERLQKMQDILRGVGEPPVWNPRAKGGR
jgi:hypothetical protein